MKNIILILLICGSGISLADVQVRGGTYTVFALLTIRPGAMPKLVVNPLSRSHYVIEVQNPDMVIGALHTSDYFGPVKVTIELFHPVDNHAAGIVRAIEITKTKLPVYDGDLHDVSASRR